MLGEAMRRADATRYACAACACAFLLGTSVAISQTNSLTAALQTATDDASLTGRDIYRKVLENRLNSYVQTSSLTSGDRSGNIQETRMRMWYQSFTGEDGEPSDGSVISKTLVKYTHPFEIRHTGYLVVNQLDRANDQFVYRPSSRLIRRVNLRGEAVFGSDFSLEDVVPKELEDSTYRRLEDATEQGQDVWVIVVTPKPEVRSEYSKVQIFVEKRRAVALRARYWDDRGTEFKELLVPADRVELQHGVWIPMHMSIRNTKLESYSKLVLSEIDPNAKIPRTDFDLRRLLSH